MLAVTKLCDFKDGFEAQTRQFSLDGHHYDIDVCRSHGESFDEAVRVWLERARHGNRYKYKSRPRASRKRSVAIRAWALARGYELEPAGRIPAAVVKAYDQAH
jgi:hypothetical protein